MTKHPFKLRVHRGIAYMLLYDRSEAGLRYRATMRKVYPHLRATGDTGSTNYCYLTANIPLDQVPGLQTVLDALAQSPEGQQACHESEERARALYSLANRT